MLHLEAWKSNLLNLLQSVTQDQEYCFTTVISLSVSHGCSCWLVEYVRAGEQLVHVVLWRLAYSRRIAYVGVSLVWPSQDGGPGLELSVQQPETENRWGEEPGFSLPGFILFYFIFLMSNWLFFPALVVFSVRLDLIWLLCSPLLCTPLHYFCSSSSFFTFFFTFLPFLPPFLNSSVLLSPPSYFLSLFSSSLHLHFVPSSSSFSCSFLHSSFLSHLFSATPALVPPSLSPHPLSSLLHPLHPLITAHGMTR